MKMLDEFGGNGNLEYAIYSTVAMHNLLRVPWHKTEGKEE
jgi:hypothetical protein